MDDASTRWLRRLVTRALDVDHAVFDAVLTAPAPRRASSQSLDGQAEVRFVAVAFQKGNHVTKWNISRGW
jgi:hypothetical protein